MSNFDNDLASLIPPPKPKEALPPTANPKRPPARPKPVPKSMLSQYLPYAVAVYLAGFLGVIILMSTKSSYLSEPVYSCIVKALLWVVTMWWL